MLSLVGSRTAHGVGAIEHLASRISHGVGGDYLRSSFFDRSGRVGGICNLQFAICNSKRVCGGSYLPLGWGAADVDSAGPGPIHLLDAEFNSIPDGDRAGKDLARQQV